jgi:hypothetical protein
VQLLLFVTAAVCVHYSHKAIRLSATIDQPCSPCDPDALCTQKPGAVCLPAQGAPASTHSDQIHTGDQRHGHVADKHHEAAKMAICAKST